VMRAPGRAIRAALNRRVQFALFRSAFAILLALVGSTAEADPQAVPRKYQAGFYPDGCKDFLAGRSNFVSGRCVGATDATDPDRICTIGAPGSPTSPCNYRYDATGKVWQIHDSATLFGYDAADTVCVPPNKLIGSVRAVCSPLLNL
jgi:hypothetical protein